MLLAFTFHSLVGSKQAKLHKPIIVTDQKHTMMMIKVKWQTSKRVIANKKLKGPLSRRYHWNDTVSSPRRKLVPKTLNLWTSFLGTCVLLYRSELWGWRPLNSLGIFTVQKQSEPCLTMSLWSGGRPGRETKVSDTELLHSV